MNVEQLERLVVALEKLATAATVRVITEPQLYPGQSYFHAHNPAVKRAEENVRPTVDDVARTEHDSLEAFVRHLANAIELPAHDPSDGDDLVDAHVLSLYWKEQARKWVRWFDLCDARAKRGGS